MKALRPYPEYKPSGVEWLGEIPAHWDMKPLKRIGSMRGGSGFPNDEQGKEDEEIPFYKVSDMNLLGNEVFMVTHNNSVSHATAVRLGANVFQSEAILFPKVGAALLTNKRRILTRVSCIDNNTMAFVVQRGLTKFFYYRMLCIDMARLANPGAVPSLNEAEASEIVVACPPDFEQQSITDFLDRETARIDGLVAKKERLIALLQEKRTALISHAVTKGLDPTAPMKDSGVEWFGRVPSHWWVGPLKREWEIVDCKHRTVPFVDDGVPIVSIGEVQGFNLDLSNANRTTRSEYLQMIEGNRKPKLGDVIYSRNATIGAAAYVNSAEDFCMGQDVCLIRSDANDQRFLVYQLRCPVVLSQLDALSVGVTFKRINVGQIKELFVCRPPPDEQRNIADHLDSKTAKLDVLIAKIRTGIERLQEYRTALISAAVTGKIDVRQTSSRPSQTKGGSTLSSG